MGIRTVDVPRDTSWAVRSNCDASPPPTGRETTRSPVVVDGVRRRRPPAGPPTAWPILRTPPTAPTRSRRWRRRPVVRRPAGPPRRRSSQPMVGVEPGRRRHRRRVRHGRERAGPQLRPVGVRRAGHDDDGVGQPASRAADRWRREELLARRSGGRRRRPRRTRSCGPGSADPPPAAACTRGSWRRRPGVTATSSHSVCQIRFPVDATPTSCASQARPTAGTPATALRSPVRRSIQRYSPDATCTRARPWPAVQCTTLEHVVRPRRTAGRRGL